MARGRRTNSASGQSHPNSEYDYEAIVARVRDEMKNEMEEKIAAINKENDEKMAKLLADFEAQLKRNMHLRAIASIRELKIKLTRVILIPRT